MRLARVAYVPASGRLQVSPIYKTNFKVLINLNNNMTHTYRYAHTLTLGVLARQESERGAARLPDPLQPALRYWLNTKLLLSI